MWNLTFITEEDFTNHVKATIEKYGEKLESFDLKRFNKNIIDPIKLIFDKTVYQSSWEEIVSNEIFRQRDKSNNNDIGYFHQRIFQYIANCHVPPNGEEGGWDVIYENVDGVEIPDAGSVHTVYVEMKNNLNGYIIVFTSNMSKERYLKLVPDPLKSRFDMVYRFVELSSEEKIRFINESAKALVTKIYENTSIEVQIDNISCKLNLLIKYNNLRSIKRKVEDIVIEEYYKEIDKK